MSDETIDEHPIEAEPDIEALLRFDPFAEQEPETEAAPEATAESQPVESPSSEATPAESAPAPQATQQDHAEKLARAAEMLTGLVQRQLTAPASAPATPKPAAEADDVPPFDFQLPAEIVDALYGDDAVLRAQALNALFRGVARTVYRQQRDDMRKYIDEQVIPTVQRGSRAEIEQRAIVNDFYGTYPQLNTPALRAFVVEELPGAAQDTNSTGWSPALKARLHERVMSRLQSLVPQQPKPEVPAKATVPAPAPAVRGSSARPAAGPPGKDDILSVLGL